MVSPAWPGLLAPGVGDRWEGAGVASGVAGAALSPWLLQERGLQAPGALVGNLRLHLDARPRRGWICSHWLWLTWAQQRGPGPLPEVGVRAERTWCASPQLLAWVPACWQGSWEPEPGGWERPFCVRSRVGCGPQIRGPQVSGGWSRETRITPSLGTVPKLPNPNLNPNLAVAGRARLWNKGFEDIPEPTPSQKAQSLTVLLHPARSLQAEPESGWSESPLACGKSKGIILHGAVTCWDPQPPFWPAGPALPPAPLPSCRPLAT